MSTCRDKFKDECGVFGIAEHREAARHSYLGLYGLQHRGQESAGIVSSDGSKLHRAKAEDGFYIKIIPDIPLLHLIVRVGSAYTVFAPLPVEIIIYKELIERNCNITYYGESFLGINKKLFNEYKPTLADRKILLERFKEKGIELIEGNNDERYVV